MRGNAKPKARITQPSVGIARILHHFNKRLVGTLHLFLWLRSLATIRVGLGARPYICLACCTFQSQLCHRLPELTMKLVCSA